MTTKNIVEYVTQNGARAIDADENSIPLFGPKWQAREGQYFLQCHFCGKDTSKQGNSTGVIVSEGGSSIIHPIDNNKEQSSAGYMGWFPVGSECIKVVPAEFRQLNIYTNKVKGTD